MRGHGKSEAGLQQGAGYDGWEGEIAERVLGCDRGGGVRDGGYGSGVWDGFACVVDAVGGGDGADAAVFLGENFPACSADGLWSAEGELVAEGDPAGWGGGLVGFHGDHEGAGFRADDVHVGAYFKDLVLQGCGANGLEGGVLAGADDD